MKANRGDDIFAYDILFYNFNLRYDNINLTLLNHQHSKTMQKYL